MNSSWDILGLGCTAVDEILYVERYPRPDAKMEVRTRQRHGGGLTATALVTAARLGARCAYAGVLGQDADSRFILETFRRERIDLRHVIRHPDAGPIRSVIVVDETRQTRNIFYDASRCRGAHPTQPAASVLRSSRVLLVDRFGMPGMIRAATLARRAGVAVVADFESYRVPHFRRLLAQVDHLIVSEGFAREFTGVRSPRRAADLLWNRGRTAVVVTCGARGCWFRDDARAHAEHLPAFRVQALDTTGCGDVFHGSYAVGLAEGWPLRDCLRFASAAAALKATKPGGQAGIPSRRAVQSFLRKADRAKQAEKG